MIDHFALWTDLDWAVIDVETTGLSPQACKVVEIAVVRMRRGQIVSTFSSLLNPGVPIPPDASRIHGIGDAQVADAPRFVDVLASVVQMTEEAIPVAYNEAFDRGFVAAELGRLNMGDGIPRSAFDSQWPAWLDPLAWIRHIGRDSPRKVSNKLTDACARMGVSIENAHRAEADAEAAGKLLWKIQDDIGASTVSEVLRQQTRITRAQEERYAAFRGRQGPATPRSNTRP